MCYQTEGYYRQCLQLMREVQDAPNEASISLGLGSFQIRRRNNGAEGCPLLMRAVQIHQDLGLPGETDTLAAALELGCLGHRQEE
jgi:hypothetical protein